MEVTDSTGGVRRLFRCYDQAYLFYNFAEHPVCLGKIMTKNYVGALLAAIAIQLPCLAGDLPFPPLLEGEWTLSTRVVMANGDKTGTPESGTLCMLPTRTMQEELGRYEQQGCTIRADRASSDSVSFTVTCAKPDGEQVISATLVAPDERSFRQTLRTAQATTELRGRRLGPCKSRTGKSGAN